METTLIILHSGRFVENRESVIIAAFQGEDSAETYINRLNLLIKAKDEIYNKMAIEIYNANLNSFLALSNGWVHKGYRLTKSDNLQWRKYNDIQNRIIEMSSYSFTLQTIKIRP